MWGSKRWASPLVITLCVLMALCVLMLLLPGCSDESSGPIKIGLLAPYSGDGQYYSQLIENGVRARLEEVGNEIEGRTIELITEDTAGDPAKGAEKAQKLVEVDQVDVVLGPLFSHVSLAVQDYLATTGTPQVVYSQSLPVMKGGIAFAPFGTTGASSALMGPYVYETLGYEQIVTMFDDYAGAEGYMMGFVDTFTAAGGEIVQEQRPPLGTVDYAPYISEMDDADAAAVWFIPPEAPTFYKQYTEYGKTMPVLYVYIGTMVDRDIQQIGEFGGVGTQGQAYYMSTIDTEANKDFVEMMTAKYGTAPTSYEEGGYVATSAFLAAVMANSGDTAHEKIIEALKGVTVDSPTGPVSFGEDGIGVCNQYIMKVVERDGQFTTETVQTFEQVANK